MRNNRYETDGRRHTKVSFIILQVQRYKNGEYSGGFYMKEIKQQVIHSWKELKSVRTLAIAAMLIGVGVVLSFFTISITESQRVGFSSLANEMIAFLFGPIAGSISAGVGDIVKYLIRPTGPFFPGFTVSALTAGFIYGIILYKRPVTFARVLMANIAVTLIVNMTLNNIWLSIMYGSRTFLGHLIVRAPIQIATIPVEAVLFYMIAKVLKEAKVFTILKK